MEQKIDTTFQPAIIHCKAFENNSGALEMVKLPKIRLQTKHLTNTYHHFFEHVKMGEIKIMAVATEEQLTDILMKPIADTLFQHLRDKILSGAY